SSATNSTAMNWSLSNPAAGVINSSGVMTWANGFYGTVDIRVTASGCNGASAEIIRTVNIGIGVLNAGFRTWTGLALDNLWQNNGNWDCGGVPTASIAVIIPEIPLAGQTETPRIETGIVGHCLTIRVEGNIADRIEIQTGGVLQVHQ
ncbi:MAG: hypothetical protein KBF73_13505, partial [Flavobacteriales bacterium]|nr:hypothetical protein [Flavobacteriales bacterium]